MVAFKSDYFIAQNKKDLESAISIALSKSFLTRIKYTLRY